MSWVRLDDAFPEHLKVTSLSDTAFRAHVSAMCYASRNLTDGFIPAIKATEFAKKRAVLVELTVALWEEAPSGYTIHDYLEYNPSKAEILARRAADSHRKRRGFQSDSFDSPSPSRSPTPNEGVSKEVSDALFAKANRFAVDPRLDTGDEHPFTQQFRERYQQRVGKDAPINQAADARALERDFGAERCIQVATDYDWQVAPSYLRSVIEGKKKDANGSGEGRGGSAASANTNGGASGARSDNERKPSLLEQRKHRTP